MKKYIVALAVAGFIASTGLASIAHAQDDPGHPRVNEVNQRLDNQQNRINNGVTDGQMGQGQAARDEKTDSRVERQETRDEAKNGGHLTKREDRHLNHELNHNSRRIHRQRHGGGRHHRQHG